jgi:putative membrane protein
MGLDTSLAPVVIAYACENYDSSKSLEDNLNAAVTPLTKASNAQNNAGLGISDPAVGTVMTNAAKNLSDADVYNTILAGLEAKGASAADAAVLIAYAAENYGSLSGDTLTDKLATVAAAIQNAKNVAAEIADSSSAEGTALINGVLNTLVSTSDDYKELTSLQDSLNGIASFVAGLKTYTNGVDSAYSGAKTLAAGTSTLKSGTDSLNSGVAALQEGINTLNDGAGKLNSGAAQLDDGVATLQSGLDEFNQKGIQKLTALFGDNVNDVLDRIHAIETAGENYNNFAGTASDSNTVKFIYKSDAIGE